MRPIRFLSHYPFVAFAFLLLVGVLVANNAYRSRVIPNPPPYPRIGILDDRQKAVLSEEQDFSRWLLALASGALTATLATRLSGVRNTDQESLTMMVAYASLILSMYGAFLSHQAKLDILRDGPPDLVYSDLLRIPTQIQAWSFVIGIVALGTAVFRRSKAVIAVGVLLFFTTAPRLHAEAFDLNPCVKTWYQQRMHTTDASTKDAVRFLAGLQKKANDPKAKLLNCNDVNEVLDNARSRVTLQENHSATLAELAAYFEALQPELDGVDGSVGDTIASFISMFSLNVPHGELVFTKPDGATKEISFRVTVDSVVLQGLTTPYQLRVTAASHAIRIQPPASFVILWQNKQYSVANGETKFITVPVQP